MKSQVMHGVIPAPGASKAASGEAEWTGDNPYEVQGSVGAPALLKKLQSVIVEVCLFVCLSVCGARVRQYVSMNAHIRKMHNPARTHTHMHTHQGDASKREYTELHRKLNALNRCIRVGVH